MFLRRLQTAAKPGTTAAFLRPREGAGGTPRRRYPHGRRRVGLEDEQGGLVRCSAAGIVYPHTKDNGGPRVVRIGTGETFSLRDIRQQLDGKVA